ncbi:DM9 repeat-containing protein [Sagittula sp. S175]|uniref:DM9 repeat-containing protein n=1 Tax=Sagittula sp. S175 TaxID=3415129 RepID=UPI003C7AAA07
MKTFVFSTLIALASAVLTPASAAADYIEMASVGGLAFGSNGSVPAGARPAGRENDGRALFSCTGMFNGAFHPGKIRQGLPGCHIGYGGKEVIVNPYFVTTNGGDAWVAPRQVGDVPPGAVIGGGENGSPLYVCRAYVKGGVHPGKIGATTRWNCNAGLGGKEYPVKDYEVLVR